MTVTKASVVIPAHNEEAVVLRCLDALHADAEAGEWEVVVTANGCTDRTVELARSHPSAPLVLDLPAPGKPAALNAADAALTAFPRIYLDADVEVSSATLRGVVATLAEPGVHAAAPRARFRTDGCSALVRSYYRVWRDLPVMRQASVGSGLFALDAEGHARVTPFPDVVAEDEYVRRSFSADERRTSPGGFDVRVARTVRALVRRGTRTRAGNRGLAQVDALADTAEAATPGPSSGRYVLSRAKDPRELPHVVVFVAVTAAVRVLAEIKLRRGDTRWERDDTSRTTADAGSGSVAPVTLASSEERRPAVGQDGTPAVPDPRPSTASIPRTPADDETETR